MIQLLGSMEISVKLPVMVRVYNIGAIFVASNIAPTLCTKHLDIGYRYVNEYVEDGVVLIISATFSPKVCAELHEKHSKKVGEKLEDISRNENI